MRVKFWNPENLKFCRAASPRSTSGFQDFSFPGRPGGVKSCPDPARRCRHHRRNAGDSSGGRAKMHSGGPRVASSRSSRHAPCRHPRGHRAVRSRREGNALGLHRQGFLFKVLYVGTSELEKSCRSTSIIWMSCLQHNLPFPYCKQFRHIRPKSDLQINKNGDPEAAASSITYCLIIRNYPDEIFTT